MNNIEERLKRLTRQNEILKNKLFTLHEYLIAKENNTNFDVSQINPFEIDDVGSEKTILAFSGMLTSLAMPKAEFFKSLKDKNINIIFLKDFHQCWYQKGLLGITKDVDTTVEFLQKIIPANTKEIYCLGTSSGGYAAILFGNLLNAKKTLAFSPQTYINKEIFIKFRTPESRWDNLKDSKYLDLLNFNNGKTTNSIYYGKYNSLDENFSKHLLGKKNIEVTSLETDTHNTAKYMKENNLLDQVLTELIS